MADPEILISEGDIKARVQMLGAQISADYADKDDLVLIGVLGSEAWPAEFRRASR